MRWVKQLMIVVVVIALLVLAYSFNLTSILSLKNMQAKKELLVHFVHTHYWFSYFGYLLLYLVVAALAIPGAALLTVLGGFLFGLIPATIAVVIGATTGATILFLFVRAGFGFWLQRRYAQQLDAFNKEMMRHGSYYLLSLRFLPVIPFFLVNILAGLTTVSLGTYVFTTAVGIIPATLIFAHAGKQLATLRSLSDVASAQVLLAFAFLALLLVLPIFLRYIANSQVKK